MVFRCFNFFAASVELTLDFKTLFFKYPRMTVVCHSYLQIQVQEGAKEGGADLTIIMPKSRESSKRKKNWFGSSRTKPKQDLFGCVSVCFVKPTTKIFGLFRCFEPISKQLK
jgi:hypothetical protein